jgi:cephalosporin-C deacetylase
MSSFLLFCVPRRTVIKASWTCYAWFLSGVLLGFATQTQALEISVGPDHSHVVKAQKYQAVVDGAGNWTSLVIDGVEMFGGNPVVGAPFPGKEPPSSINLRDRLLAIRNEKVIVEYSFDETGINLETEGAALIISLSPAVTALVQASGEVKGSSVNDLADVRKVIAGQAAFEIDQPYHWQPKQGGLLPSVLTRGTKAEIRFKARFECGISPDADELVEIHSFEVRDWKEKTVPRIKAGEAAVFNLELRNLGTQEVRPEIVYSTGDAFSGGNVSQEAAVAAPAIKSGESATLQIPITPGKPGIHWVNLELRNDGKALKRQRRAFVYDMENFRPKLTRPDDFADFWKARLKALRAVPIEAKLTEIPERSTGKAVHYQLEMNDPQGKRITMDLQAPRIPGKYLAVFGGKMPEKANDANRILLVISHKTWPEEATYNRWVSAEDNNLLDCFLLAVRITDYLRSREDVKGIYLKGASRQGPIQLVNAALDPSKVVGVDAHVPTSMGVSWTELPYRGWGEVPNPPSMANYVDPVNFAEDLTVPVIIDEGVYDGLSPAPGAIAFYNAATKTPWKRLSIESAGHGYFTSGFRPQATAELEKLLGMSLEQAMDDKILREH